MRYCVCAHHHTHTYEKSGSACDSRVVLLRGVQAILTIQSRRLFLSSIFSSVVLGWLERGNHLFARLAHSRGRSEGCPFTHPTDPGHVVLGLTNQEKYSHARTYDFSSFHTLLLTTSQPKRKTNAFHNATAKEKLALEGYSVISVVSIDYE